MFKSSKKLVKQLSNKFGKSRFEDDIDGSGGSPVVQYTLPGDSDDDIGVDDITEDDIASYIRSNNLNLTKKERPPRGSLGLRQPVDDTRAINGRNLRRANMADVMDVKAGFETALFGRGTKVGVVGGETKKGKKGDVKTKKR